MIRIVRRAPSTLAPHAAGLSRLEARIHYPLGEAGDSFTIDHGPAYHPFFSGLGDAHFLLALDGNDDVVGTVAGVLRRVERDGLPVDALYIGDLKVAPALRGAGLARRLLLHGLVEIVRDPGLRRARLLYGAAMGTDEGRDVMHSARGLHPGRLASPLGRLRLYFAAREALLRVEDAPLPAPGAGGLDLSPGAPPRESTLGRKDLRIASTGKPWPLVHLGQSPARPDYASTLRAQAAALDPGVIACIALDETLEAHHALLTRAGLAAGATCTVYGLGIPPWWRPTWLHLSSAHI